MNVKRMILLLFFVAIQAGKNHAAQIKTDTDIITVQAVATSSNVFTLDDDSTIILYAENNLIINETYVLLVDPVNDNEVLNYCDLETYELNNHEFVK